MFNLNYILFFFFRFNFVKSDFNNYKTITSNFSKTYNFYTVNKVNRKKEILMNYKIFWFKFVTNNTKLQYTSNYFIYLYFFMQSNKYFKSSNLLNLNINILNITNNLIFLNLRFKWIYRLKSTLVYVKKYFFFIKSLHKLKYFILRNKNINHNLLNNTSIYNILNVCLSYGFCYNFYSLLNLIKLKFIWINNLPVSDSYIFIKNNDLIQFYIHSLNSKFIFNMINYNKQIIESNANFKINIFKKCNFFFSNNAINLKINMQGSYLNMSFIKIKFKTSFYVNNCVNSFFNLSNIRLYNWLIIN